MYTAVALLDLNFFFFFQNIFMVFVITLYVIKRTFPIFPCHVALAHFHLHEAIGLHSGRIYSVKNRGCFEIIHQQQCNDTDAINLKRNAIFDIGFLHYTHLCLEYLRHSNTEHLLFKEERTSMNRTPSVQISNTYFEQ